MESFRYRVKTKSGVTLTGSLQAESVFTAMNILSREGYYPLEVQKQDLRGMKFRIFTWPNKIPLRDLGRFTRQLADLSEAGLPLARALEVSHIQTFHPRLKKIIEELRCLVRGGKSMFEALGTFPETFSPMYIGLIRAGEMGGDLGGAFLRLADYQEKQEEFRARVRAAMAYPLFVAAVGVGTIAFLMAVVVPKLSAMFSDMGQTLPLPTKLLIQSCAYVVRYGLIVVLGVIAILAIVISQEKVKMDLFDRFILRLPLLGYLMRRIATARFARTLEILLSGGVSLIDALRLVSGVMENRIMRAQTLEAARRVRGGVSLSESLRACPVFPSLLHQMVAIGEEGNTVEKAMDRLAMIYERDSDRSMKTILSLLEPALILTVGGAVGIIVIAMLLPIFQIPAFVR